MMKPSNKVKKFYVIYLNPYKMNLCRVCVSYYVRYKIDLIFANNLIFAKTLNFVYFCHLTNSYRHTVTVSKGQVNFESNIIMNTELTKLHLLWIEINVYAEIDNICFSSSFNIETMMSWML